MIFSILIPIYNRLAITRQGLQALYAALDLYKAKEGGNSKFEVIVIDDGSTDGSSEWIAQNYKDVHLLRGDGNLWWSGATNKGADYAVDTLHTDYLLLWNDDIFPDNDYFIRVDEVFHNHRFSNTVIGSKILSKNTGKTWSVGGYFSKWGKYGMYSDPGQQSSGFFECDWLPGMGTIVPVSAFSGKGIRWDEQQFPQYHGDSDYTLRCKENGFKIVTCLDLIIYNASDNPGTGGNKNLAALWWGLSSMRSNYNFRKRWVFYKRHGVQLSHYWGLAHTYVFYIGSFFKRHIFKIPVLANSQPKDLNGKF